MGLTEIPVLPESYPLFDWADWPDSRAALVQGGETRKFQRACWNAMVDLFVGAMEEAELPMPEGISLELLRIPEDPLYGPMTAARMNGMLKTIEGCIYLWRQWRWDYDNTLRGFINRRYFRASYNSNIVNIDPDIVYPEYFLELAQSMNLVLELMRGTWPTVKTGAEVVTGFPNIYAGGISNHALLAEVNMNITGARVSEAPVILCKPVLLHDASWDLKTLISPCVTSHKAALGERWLKNQSAIYAAGRSTLARLLQCKDVLIQSSVYASGISTLYLPISRDIKSESEIYAGGLAGWALHEHYEKNITSKLFSNGFSGIALPANKSNMKTSTRIYSEGMCGFGRASRIWQKSASLVRADSAANTALFGQGEVLTGSVAKATCSSNLARWTSASMESTVETEADALSHPALLTEAKTGAVLSADVTPEQLPYQNLPATGHARSGATVLILNQEGLTFQTRHCSTASARGALDTAWLPPERVGDGLWIRQIYRTKKRPDGSLDLSGTWDPVSSRARSVSAVSAGLVSGWLPPVRHEGVLYIRQVRRLEVLEDGSLNLAPYDPAMAVRHSSATAACAILDTAWYPPVTVDGGLYLRQSQAADINENSELEVG